ncbi:AraC family transcriptional regulator [Clostridium sp. SYSU_GA19001]|uniref:AraC family transcriptional regulator n=1 Tax=Clostridium caldaquaticum TaxID=2940653 RepID=UPI002076DD76|nr:AraC family transcriptional regulator [Clostridium caldaquaticum]MCM8711542.1 AraC family transcriptional regulator [Clostridium caldaquaticum]
MDYKELDEKLRTLTARELHYKSNPGMSEKYKHLDPIDYHGKKVYLFNLKDAIAGENISVLKHTRFAEVPMHKHDYIELNYVYSGKVTQIVKDKTITLKEGQICIVDTEVPHSILPTGEEDIIINLLIRKEYFTTSFLSRLSSKGIISEFLVTAVSDKKNHDNYIIFNSDNNRRIPNLMKELLCEYFDKSLYADEIIDCYMILIFTELMKVFQYDANQAHANSNGNASIIDILQYLEKNYMTCTLESTAAHFNFHPNYLSSLIKKTTNKSFKELIQAQRLTRSAILLTNSHMPVYEIANEIGYQNLNFFYKKFKDYFGVTPNEYREKNNKSKSN